MQKEEFPTFLNEQPVIIFGRTGRELMVMAIGASLAYLLWLDLDKVLGRVSLGEMVIKGIICAAVIILSLIVALVNVAGRPLEEWATVGVLYFLMPKVYLYMPMEETEAEEGEKEKGRKVLKQVQQDDEEY